MPSHRLLNYTTFENNQYKFSLNNATRPVAGGSNGSISANSSNSGIAGGGSGGGSLTNTPHHVDHFVEWPNTPAAPYYYQGPSSVAVHAKKRDAKSDLGVPTRRLSGQAITKTQLLTGGSAGNYPPLGSIGYPLISAQYPGIGFNSRLHPAKSDLFLAYPSSAAAANQNEYEPPFIYNYKMPHMPEFVNRNSNKMSTQSAGQQQQHQQQSGTQPSQQPTAYHISGAQTADPLPPNCYKANSNTASSSNLYAGAAPATDVMYYQFDNSCVASSASTSSTKPPAIVQQPKSLMVHGKAAVISGGNSTGSPAHSLVGPLVFLQHPQSQQQQQHNQNTGSSSVNNSMPQTVSTFLQVTCLTAGQ